MNNWLGIDSYQSHHIVPGCVRVNILVKQATNIPRSIHKYSVEIAVEKSVFGKTGKKTFEIMALNCPRWNQTLSFLVKECDWFSLDTLNIVFNLCCTDKDMNDQRAMSMNKLFLYRRVEFGLKDGKYISIEVDVSCLRYTCTEAIVETDVIFRKTPMLCKPEREFFYQRRRFVCNKMKDKISFESSRSSTPNIAIIGSGGGMRAVIGMCGAMTALEDLGILDYAMYTAGVSGSAWYLTTLYANDQELNPKAVTDSIRNKLKQSFLKRLCQVWYTWKSYTESKAFSHGKYFTTTDSFGEMIGALLLGKKCKQKWSEQRKKLVNGCAPLPLITALQTRGISKKIYEWVEFSPYEVSIPTYGAAIDMTHFGNRFYGGFLTKEYGEQPIHFLQGVCGSGYAKVLDQTKSDKQMHKYFNMIKNWIFSWFERSSEEIIARVPNWLQGVSNNTSDTNKKENVVDGTDEEMLLVDAGIEFNSPYPAVLHPAREVGIILSFDFSYRDGGKKSPFEQLLMAEKWAKERSVPFPEIKTNDKGEPYNEMYIFKGKGKEPTIMHFIMADNKFREELRRDSSKRSSDLQNFDIFADYHTLKFSYTEQEFDRFKSLIEFNVWTNQAKIFKCIQKGVDREKPVPILKPYVKSKNE